MRRCYLVCYDIANPKRLRQVHKSVKGYGQAWQYSVFYCHLKELDVVRLRIEMEQIMNLAEDQLLIIDLGPQAQNAIQGVQVLGYPLPEIFGSIRVV